MHKQRLIILIIAVVGVISIFLPWVSSGVLNADGLNNGGKLSLIAFSVPIIICFLGDRNQPLISGVKYGIVAAGVVSALNGLIVLITLLAQNIFDVSPGVGLLLTIMASITVAVVPLIPSQKSSTHS